MSKKLSTILDNYKHITFKQLRIIKLIFYGAPRAGKTTLRKQLLRHIQAGKLQSCGNIEPSTPIAVVCDPIFVERIVMTNEENNEWKWTVQKLDDIAKALLLCLDNKQLQGKSTFSDVLKTSGNRRTMENDFPSVSMKYHDVQQNPNVEQQESTESHNFGVHNTPSQALEKEASSPIRFTEPIETNQQKMTMGLDIKKLFQNAVKTGKWEEVVGALNIDKAMFLHIIDGGGQPSFQEIFPLLISGPSLTLLIFKLTDDLEKLYQVHYQPDAGTGESKAWEDYYIVKDIISHALASFTSQQDTATPFLSKMLLVGTHKDELEVSLDPRKDKESKEKAKIVSIAKQLHGYLIKSKAFESIQVSSIEDLVTGIDNNNEHDIVSIKSKIEEMISQFDSGDIPAPWLVFDFVLHTYAKSNKLRKAKKSECERIASECGVKDYELNVVLHYLHFVAGTLLYYSDIPKLKHYVITDFQLIFDSISKIIIQYFDHNSGHGHIKHKDLFKQKGQLDTSVLKNVEGCLEVDELLSLLQHRHIISKIEKSMFFMPCVLPKVVLSYNQSSNSSSFLVLFDHGYCPVGLFCAATTRLIVEHKWTVNTGESQFRNKINFYCTCSGKSYSVVFSAFSAHYEVCLVKEALPIVKYKIYQNINDVFAKVCEDMKYPSPSYGFYCPETCKCGDTSHLQYQHPAMCTFSCETLEMKCCYSDTPSDLKDENKQWFTQVCVKDVLF